ncbi:uncharacterized protein BDW43DRAFT_307392 [Aspergillus alliaceus]|uniref:uncharacterized protein n=1 Tax=Petromyces alliaceus TaxID=209559 RepID=UPI0012A5F185|nr:uncharacterized protein BDW43DRAFT_307392 [Aspergillus alliaceus]KAB8237106.1 hypothetical protein BDW43DRAFT_307392 [Aspergillus alliaceus]
MEDRGRRRIAAETGHPIKRQVPTAVEYRTHQQESGMVWPGVVGGLYRCVFLKDFLHDGIFPDLVRSFATPKEWPGNPMASIRRAIAALGSPRLYVVDPKIRSDLERLRDLYFGDEFQSPVDARLRDIYKLDAKLANKQHLEEQDDLGINLDRNRHPNPNVHYHRADLSSAADVERAMQIARPVTIFHTTSPEFSDVPESAYTRIIVNGTQHLLNSSAKSEPRDAISPTPKTETRVYCLAKADAEEAIQAANRNGGCDDHAILTCALRPCLTFGEHDVSALGRMVAAARRGRLRFQMGNGQNPYDFMYVGNLADAYLLAAHALLNAWGRLRHTDLSVWVDGEVFNISNDDPWLFWDFQSAVSALTRNPIRPEDIVVIPKWVGLVIGFLGEWVVWATSGRTRTADMTREGIRFSTLIRTLDISKAKRVLGYCPAVGV